MNPWVERNERDAAVLRLLATGILCKPAANYSVLSNRILSVEELSKVEILMKTLPNSIDDKLFLLNLAASLWRKS